MAYIDNYYSKNKLELKKERKNNGKQNKIENRKRTIEKKKTIFLYSKVFKMFEAILNLLNHPEQFENLQE